MTETIVVLKIHTCISCGITFAMPVEYDRRLNQTHESFYCPNGHSQNYVGQSDKEKLEQERRRHEQDLREKNTEIEKLKKNSKPKPNAGRPKKK